jgi:hypothetical protein
MAVVVFLMAAGCGGRGAKPQIDSARRFRDFPLYWVGDRFEKWDLTTIQGLDRPGSFVSFIYGTCTPNGGEQSSCTPPFEIQVSPLCSHLDVVAAAPVWKMRQIRGAPLGKNPDGAPVLFTRRAQVKVYRGQGSYAGVAFRVFYALRSINNVRPVVGADDDIPGPGTGVLEGTRSCRT